MGVEKVSADELNALKESMGIKPLEPVDNRTEEEKQEAEELKEQEFYDNSIKEVLANSSFVEEEDEEGNKWLRFLDDENFDADEDLEYETDSEITEESIVEEVSVLKHMYKEFEELPTFDKFVLVGQKNNMSREQVFQKYVAIVQKIKKDLNINEEGEDDMKNVDAFIQSIEKELAQMETENTAIDDNVLKEFQSMPLFDEFRKNYPNLSEEEVSDMYLDILEDYEKKLGIFSDDGEED